MGSHYHFRRPYEGETDNPTKEKQTMWPLRSIHCQPIPQNINLPFVLRQGCGAKPQILRQATQTSNPTAGDSRAQKSYGQEKES